MVVGADLAVEDEGGDVGVEARVEDVGEGVAVLGGVGAEVGGEVVAVAGEELELGARFVDLEAFAVVFNLGDLKSKMRMFSVKKGNDIRNLMIYKNKIECGEGN